MYKKQVKWQKIFCLMALIVSAVVFVYSLGLATDLNDALSKAMPFAEDPDNSAVTGARIFYDIQPFNKALMPAGLGLIILAVVLFITNTHSRRRYYIGNYVATGLWSVAAVATAIWSHIEITGFKAQFQNTVNFDELAAYAEEWGTPALTRNDTFWFDIHYLVMVLLLVMVVILVGNAVWKTSLMRQEAALLAGAPDKKAAGAQAK